MAKVPPRRLHSLSALLAQFRRRAGSAPEAYPLRPEWLDTVTDELLTAELRQLAERTLPVSFHSPVFARAIRFLRHALAHLVRGQDPLPERLTRCITPGEAYVPGLGPGFWATVVRSLDPGAVPQWCPAVER